MAVTKNDIEAELSYAYLHAVGARAGFSCKIGNRHDDNAGVDAFIRVDEKLAPDSTFWNFDFEIQLKATTKPTKLRKGHYPYFMKELDRYNTLREPGSPLPKILVVMFLPDDPKDWLTQSERSLIARRCAYWVSLQNAPESYNESGQTVYLPKRQMLSVAGLRELALRLSREEVLTYDG